MTISDGEARSRQWNQIKADVLGEDITPSLRVEAPAIRARPSWPAWARACSAPSKMASPSPSSWPRPCTPHPEAAAMYTGLRQHWESVRATVFPSFAARPPVPPGTGTSARPTALGQPVA